MTTPVHGVLARLFGLDKRHVFGFELRCFVGEAVTMIVHERLIDEKPLRVREFTQKFRLSLDDPAPPEDDWAYAAMRRVIDGTETFDIDRACEAAMERVCACIEESARRALQKLCLKTAS